jgi:hypothetical protein
MLYARAGLEGDLGHADAARASMARADAIHLPETGEQPGDAIAVVLRALALARIDPATAPAARADAATLEKTNSEVRRVVGRLRFALDTN